MSAYIRFVLSLVIACSVYGLFVPVLVSMKDTTAVISGIALAILAPPCIYAICKGLVVTVHKEKK